MNKQEKGQVDGIVQDVSSAKLNSAPAHDPLRRGIVGGSALAAMAAMFGSGRAHAQGDDWTEVEKNNVRVVEAFCQAWATQDLDQVTATMSDDCIYRMTETTPAVHGHQSLKDQMQPWVDTSHDIEFEILQTIAKGPIVMNHRIDYWRSETRPVTWEGVGIFFMRDGKIVEWSDYNIRVERG